LTGHGYHLGVAVAPLGGTTAFVFGDWPGGEAWSTIKVPLALAVVQTSSGISLGDGSDKYPYGACKADPSTGEAIRKALVNSDNCSAWQLWEGLGGDNSRAAAAVTQVLRSGGDATTTVTSTGNGHRLTSGMTVWSLTDQATFAAHLPQLDGSQLVWTTMGLPAGDSGAGTGLHIFAGAHVKDGAGSAPPGGPVTRQLGVISVGDGMCSAVAIGTDRSGSAFSTLTSIASVLRANMAALPAGPCPPGMAG